MKCRQENLSARALQGAWCYHSLDLWLPNTWMSFFLLNLWMKYVSRFKTNWVIVLHLSIDWKCMTLAFVEDVEFLIPVKFGQIPFSSLREVEDVSIRRQGGHLGCFPISPKNTNLVEEVVFLLPLKFPLIPFRVLRGEDKKDETYTRRHDQMTFSCGACHHYPVLL